MSRFRVSNFAVSLDGYSAGPNQDLENPLGVGGLEIMQPYFQTRSCREMHGREGGETGIDSDFGYGMFRGVGAWILGRNMFGPIRGPWPDDAWKGWWGDDPCYHKPVFVLTHQAREPVEMKGGTTFYFVTDGIESASRAPARRPRTRTSCWAEACPRSSSTGGPGYSTNCISSRCPCSSEPERACSPVSMRASLATPARSACPPRRRRTSC